MKILVIAEQLTARVTGFVNLLVEQGMLATVSQTTENTIKEMMKMSYDKVVWFKINQNFVKEDVLNEIQKEKTCFVI